MDGHTFVIEDIYPQKLKELTDEDVKQEGFNSLKEYKEILTSIHGEAVWGPEQINWTHQFKGK